MDKIGIVHNPNARRNRGDKEKPGRLSEILGSLGIVRETKSTLEVGEVAREYLKRGIKLLGINGGDGTYHQVVSRFINVYKEKALPSILHMRGGTMNTIANSFGVLRGSAEKVLRDIVEKYRNNDNIPSVEREILKVSRSPGSGQGEEQYGFMFGAGAATKFLAAYYEGEKTGPRKALQMIVKAISSAIMRTDYIKNLLEPVDATLYVDDQELDIKKFTLIYASTIKQVGLGFKVAYRAGEKPGYFHLVAGPLRAWDIIKNIPTVYRGLPTHIKTIHDDIHKKITLRGPDELSYTIDGELYMSDSPITVTLGPKLKMITA